MAGRRGAHLATMPLQTWYSSGARGRNSCAMAYSSGGGRRTPQSSRTTRAKKSAGMATRQPAPSPAPNSHIRAVSDGERDYYSSPVALEQHQTRLQ